MSKIYSNKIINVAKKFIGTKFHYYGRIAKNKLNNGGIDCIGLILKVGEEVNSTFNGKNIIKYDNLEYSKQPNKNELKNNLDKYFIKINEKDLKNGDIIYFQFDNKLEHIAIFNDENIIHCYIEAKGVVEHIFDKYWRDKIIAYYRYPTN